MEYYAKSRQKILTQGEIDKVKNELEDLIMNLEGEFTETDLKIIRNNISHLQDTEEEGQGDSREPVQEQKNQLTGELHATQTAEEISIPEENRDALYQKNRPFPRTQEKNLCPAVGAWEKQWECFCAAHPLCCPFDEDGNVYAVKLQMQDFKILPKEYQYLANNSFLLHGYFNYKMVLFGYMEAEQRQWFLGVPGVLSNQEQLMAGIFGCPEFRTKQMTRQKTGESGYWYRFIEI